MIYRDFRLYTRINVTRAGDIYGRSKNILYLIFKVLFATFVFWILRQSFSAQSKSFNPVSSAVDGLSQTGKNLTAEFVGRIRLGEKGAQSLLLVFKAVQILGILLFFKLFYLRERSKYYRILHLSLFIELNFRLYNPHLLCSDLFRPNELNCF